MTRTSPPIEALAAVIHTLREARGISATRLAHAARMTEPTFRRRLLGRPKPFDLDELEAVAQALGTTGFDLLTAATQQGADAA